MKFNLSTVLIALSAAIGWADRAAAQWQNTRWDMTVEEARAAIAGSEDIAAGDTQRASTAGAVALLKFKWKSGALPFNGFALFDGESLSQIKLDLAEVERCARLRVMLQRKYGVAGIVERSPLIDAATWSLASMEVSFFSTAIGGKTSLCTVSFFSRRHSDNSGL